ncbi:MAG: endolytic transglycosylase MltG [Bacteroidales bacterium]|nr:endolytic transglycosylase MltG [Bacteroidales bacterium]
MVKFERRRSRQMGKAVRISMLVVFLGLVIMVLVVYKLYSRVFVPNVMLDTEHELFYVPSGSSFEAVIAGLEDQGIIENSKSFEWVALKKGYDTKVNPGRYKIPNGFTNNELVNMLRSGNQDPVMVVFNNVRTLNHLSGKVSQYLELDSVTLATYLGDKELPSKYGFDAAAFSSMFIPETYEFFWNTSPEEFADRMKLEYERFWEGGRDRKAEKMKLTRAEVTTLASIVDEETLYDDENSRVAGLYLNRLEQGIPLQADPTLKYALGDFSRQRILNEDKEIESSYNTYKFKGLPPGPISIPSVSAIDGVLDFEKHRYLYMCAKADFSGYHAFARDYSQHLKNAREYQRALNRKRIYK